MIKNQLYPYLEEYINEYLWGFSKEQIEVGLIDGNIILNNLNIRPDKANLKLNSSNLPVWIKAGFIKKIQISCSLMNFIGEKPLDVLIEDIDCLLCPSLKYIQSTAFNYIVEDLSNIKEKYVPASNNHQDIFKKKLMYNDDKLGETVEEDQSTPYLTRLSTKIINQVQNFYHKNSYLINIKIKNVHVRFEDDMFNYFGKTCFGLTLAGAELKLAIDGSLKKTNFKIDNLSIYNEKTPKILICSDYLTQRKYVFDDDYYKFIKKLNFDTGQERQLILNNFSSKGNIGFRLLDNNNIDFFSSLRKKSIKFYFQIATSGINLYIDNNISNKMNDLIFYFRNFSMITSIQKFKPKRRPYSKNSIIVSNNKKNTNFIHKRKMVVKDWFFFMIWSMRWKQMVNSKKTTYKNHLHELQTKYFKTIYSRYYAKSQVNTFLVEPIATSKDFLSSIEEMKDNEKKTEIFENIILTISKEILIKSINIDIGGLFQFKINELNTNINIENGVFDLKTELSALNLLSQGIDSRISDDPNDRVEESQDICFTSRNLIDRPLLQSDTKYIDSSISIDCDEPRPVKNNYFKISCIKENLIKPIIPRDSRPKNIKKEVFNKKYNVLQDTLMQELGGSRYQLKHNSSKILKHFNIKELIQDDDSSDQSELLLSPVKSKISNLSHIINQFNKELLQKKQHQKTNTSNPNAINLVKTKYIANSLTNSLNSGEELAYQKKFSVNISDLLNTERDSRKDSSINPVNKSSITSYNKDSKNVKANLDEIVKIISLNKDINKVLTIRATQNFLEKQSTDISLESGEINVNLSESAIIRFLEGTYSLDLIKNVINTPKNIMNESDPKDLYIMKNYLVKRLNHYINRYQNKSQDTKRSEFRSEFNLCRAKNLMYSIENELKELDLLDMDDNTTNYYEVNKLVNMGLLKFPTQVSINCNGLNIVSYNRETEPLCRAKITNPYFKASLSRDRLFARIFGNEFEYMKFNQIKHIANQIYGILRSQYESKASMFEPFIGEILKSHMIKEIPSCSRGTLGNKTENNINNLYTGNKIENQLIEVNLNIHNINVNKTDNYSITRNKQNLGNESSKRKETDKKPKKEERLNIELGSLSTHLKEKLKDDENEVIDFDFNGFIDA